MLSTADLHDYFQSCVLLRGPTYRVHSTKINMLLDRTKVQCSASGGVLLTVSAILLLTFPDSHSYNYQRKKSYKHVTLENKKKKECAGRKWTLVKLKVWLSSLWMDHPFNLPDLQCLHVDWCEFKLGRPLNFYTGLLAHQRNSYLSLGLILPFLPPLILMWKSQLSSYR